VQLNGKTRSIAGTFRYDNSGANKMTSGTPAHPPDSCPVIRVSVSKDFFLKEESKFSEMFLRWH